MVFPTRTKHQPKIAGGRLISSSRRAGRLTSPASISVRCSSAASSFIIRQGGQKSCTPVGASRSPEASSSPSTGSPLWIPLPPRPLSPSLVPPSTQRPGRVGCPSFRRHCLERQPAPKTRARGQCSSSIRTQRSVIVDGATQSHATGAMRSSTEHNSRSR